jgi:hypothetical protein
MAASSMNSAHACTVSALVLLMSLWEPMSALGEAADACPTAPPGAKALGYVRKVFCVSPTTADISVSNNVPSLLYSGPWYTNGVFPMSMYSASGQALALASGAYVSTETRKSLPGILPLLPGSSGFYVEFAERLSDNDPDHWPAVWLMPQEHNSSQSDHQAGDPAKYERWMELDVDEGGFNKTGHHGAMINWYSTYPNYERVASSNDPVSSPPMDRTQEHIFGMSYDPVRSVVTWWVDGVNVGTASTAAVPAVVKTYHYYLIMCNQTHGLNHPYTMYVRYFSAWTASAVPNPPSGVKADSPK